MSDQPERLTAQVVTVSTRGAAGTNEDTSGPILCDGLIALGLEVAEIEVVPDQLLVIQQRVLHHCDITHVSLVALTGGSGPTPDDVTPEALTPLLDRDYSGVAAALMIDGRAKIATAPLSRVVAGQRGRTIVIALPGSPGGVRDALTTLEPLLLHWLQLIAGHSTGH